jgi:hypothetical protein
MAESARATDNALPLGDATGTNADQIDAYLDSIGFLSSTPPLISHVDGDRNWRVSRGWTAAPATEVPAGNKFMVAGSHMPDNGKCNWLVP